MAVLEMDVGRALVRLLILHDVFQQASLYKLNKRVFITVLPSPGFWGELVNFYLESENFAFPGNGRGNSKVGVRL